MMLNRVDALKIIRKLPKKELLNIIEHMSYQLSDEIAQLKLDRSNRWFMESEITYLRGKLAHYKAKEPPITFEAPLNIEETIKKAITDSPVLMVPSFCEKVKDFLRKVYGKIASLY